MLADSPAYHLWKGLTHSSKGAGRMPGSCLEASQSHPLVFRNSIKRERPGTKNQVWVACLWSSVCCDLGPVVTSLSCVSSFPNEASWLLSRANAIKCVKFCWHCQLRCVLMATRRIWPTLGIAGLGTRLWPFSPDLNQGVPGSETVQNRCS